MKQYTSATNIWFQQQHVPPAGPEYIFMPRYTKDEEIELLQKQLVVCTTAMREVANALRDAVATENEDALDLCELANQLELARSKPVTL